MNVSTEEMKILLEELYSTKSGEEKLLMALSMFNTSRELVIASLPDNLSEKELRKELFLRFYGNEFDEKEKEKIIAQLMK